MLSWSMQYPMFTQFRVSTNSLIWNILLSGLDSPPRSEETEYFCLRSQKTETRREFANFTEMRFNSIFYVEIFFLMKYLE